LQQKQKDIYAIPDKVNREKLLNKERKVTIMDFTGEFDKEFPPLDNEYIVPW
jgi:hypothetical protein